MKKILSYVLVVLLIFPMFISASSYADALSIKNSYITKYSDYDKYFTSENGEFLSKNEYNLTKYGAYSYLATGTAYWLKDSCGTNKYHVLSDSLNCKNKSSNVGIKIMYKPNSDIEVSGSGSQSNPWVFVETYKIYIDTADKATGIVSPSGLKYANTNGTYNYNYTVKDGYEYSSVKCKGITPSVDKTSSTITFTNILTDTSCAVIFKSKDLKVSLDHNGGSGTSLISEIYYKYNTAWYSDDSITNKITKIDSLPTRDGFKFGGYYMKDANGNLNKQVIDAEGNITTEHKLFSSDVTIYAKWIDITPPTCKLKVTASGVVFDTKEDNVGVVSYGINKSTTPSYGNNSISLSNGIFYGHVKDAAGNIGVCRATISSTYATKFDKTTKTCGRTLSSYDCWNYMSKSYYCPDGYDPYSGGSYDCRKYVTWSAKKNYCSSYTNSTSCANASASCTWSYGECKGTYHTCSSGNMSYNSSGYYCWTYYYSNYYTNYYCSSGTPADGYCWKYNQSSCGSWYISDYNYNYSFSSSTSNDVENCNPESSFTCNYNNLDESYVSSCVGTEFACSVGTKITDSHCYVIN